MTQRTINLNELKLDDEFKNALGILEQTIIKDYDAFGTNTRMKQEFRDTLGYSPNARKYLRIVTGNSVWGFINLTNPKFKEGDILKSAGWNTPALNQARGNLFDTEYSVAWTGPHYISGYSAGGTRKCGNCGEPIKTLLEAI